MGVIKFSIAVVWPFIREMMLNGKTIVEAFKENKARTLFALSVMATFVIAIWSTVRTLELAHENVILQDKIKELQGSRKTPIQGGLELKQNVHDPKKKPAPELPPEHIVTVKPPKPPQRPRIPPADVDSYEHFKRTMEEIRQREEGNQDSTKTQ